MKNVKGMNEYLNRVLIYLRQELPEYSRILSVEDGKLVFKIDADFNSFNEKYDRIFHVVTLNVNRIRNRESDLYFSVISSNQIRDFTITK